MSDDLTPGEGTPEPEPQQAAASEQPAVYEPPPAQPHEPPPAAWPASPPPAPAAPRHRRGGGALWWGMVLIILGGLLLVNQFAPGVELWRYWPLIIVAVGVRGMFGSSTGHWSVKVAAEGLTVVAIGLVFLGQMLGYLGWDVWLNIFRLWPVLLISLGLEIIGKGTRAEWLRVVSSLVVIGALAYGALFMTSNGSWPPVFSVGTIESEPFSERAEHESDVGEGSAVVKAGVGEFTLEAGRALATAEGRSPFDLRFDATTSDEVADVEIKLTGSSVGPVGESRLDVTLDREVVWDLEVDTGVSTFDVDLSGLALSSLVFNTGVSKGTVTLGESDASGATGRVGATIKGGVSSLTVRVPKRDDVRISVRTGLSTLDFAGDWDRTDKNSRRIYESPRFRTTGSYWDIELDAGIGAITVEYY